MKTNKAITAMLTVIVMLAGCGHLAKNTETAVPSASAEPTATATVEPTADATATLDATVEPSATPEATSTPEVTIAPTPEATAQATAEPTAEVSQAATDDDCGWISDPSMADGGWCSYHPEWYGMTTDKTQNQTSNQNQQPQATATCGQVTFYNQLDGRWRNAKVGDATFGPHGCCPTALAMMLSSRGIAMTPLDVAYLLNSWGIFGNSANGFLGTRSDAWPRIADYYGWQYSELYTADDLYNALAQGCDVGLALNYGGAGHTVYVRGVDAYGNTTVYDGNSSGPYTKSIYTLWGQIFDPYEIDGAAVAIAQPGASAPASSGGSYAPAKGEDVPVAQPGEIVCYNENGEQIACNF